MAAEAGGLHSMLPRRGPGYIVRYRGGGGADHRPSACGAVVPGRGPGRAFGSGAAGASEAS